MRNVLLGLIAGILLVLASGMAQVNGAGRYQLEVEVGGTRIYYARMDTVTGEVEYWRYSTGAIDGSTPEFPGD